MKVLYLGPPRDSMFEFLKSCGDEICWWNEPIADVRFYENQDFLVSYGYRYIIKSDVIRFFAGRAINLHISFLPWNRGADPNLWSFLEDTPKGVTIHLLDEGVDTGKIIAQEAVSFSDSETLKTSYERLSRSIENLFGEIWIKWRDGQLEAYYQTGSGTFHYAKDKLKYQSLLVQGWDTPVRQLIGKAIGGQ